MTSTLPSAPRSAAVSPLATPESVPARAIALADDLRRHALREVSHNQLSPTDAALLLRIEAFLRHDVGRHPVR